MKWATLGRVFVTDRYSQCPTPLALDDRLRVFYAARLDRNESSIHYVDLDLNDPTKIIGKSTRRILDDSKPGCFDRCGQIPSFAQRVGHKVNLFYSGWVAAADGCYQNAIGLAVSANCGETFQRPFDGPLMDRTATEPYLAVTPSIVGNKMFYVSGLRWAWLASRFEPIYAIHAAQSDDGLHWERQGQVIPQTHPHECHSRPYVLKLGDEWQMWYCYRSALDYRDGANAYRIGYADSADGETWHRHDALIDLPRSDFDTTMQCYPAVFEAKGKTYMLYNGNTFGKHGFGIAIAE